MLNSPRNAILIFVAVTCLPAGAVRAQRPISAGAIRTGTLSFDGHATLGDFTGTTTTVTGEMTGGASLASVRGWVEAPVRTLVTGNSKRDADLNKSMESGKYPTIRYELADVVPGAARGDTVAATLQGDFLIHGVRRRAGTTVTVVFLRDGVRVRGEVPLNLKTFGIGGLTKLFGILKMHEQILVHLDLTFGSGSPAPAIPPRPTGISPGGSWSGAPRWRRLGSWDRPSRLPTMAGSDLEAAR